MLGYVEVTLLCGDLSFFTRVSVRSKTYPFVVSTASRLCQNKGCSGWDCGKQSTRLVAETAQSEQSAIVGFRPSMTTIDADVMLEPVGGGENGARQDADVFRQGCAIQS